MSDETKEQFGEPWESENGVITKADGDRVPDKYEDAIDDRDADRIVACVNFCRGIPTKYLATRVIEWTAPETETTGILKVRDA